MRLKAVNILLDEKSSKELFSLMEEYFVSGCEFQFYQECLLESGEKYFTESIAQKILNINKSEMKTHYKSEGHDSPVQYFMMKRLDNFMDNTLLSVS